MAKFRTGEDFYNRIYLIFNALIAVSLLPFSLIFLDIQKNGNQDSMVNGIAANGLNLIAICLIIFFAHQSYKDLKTSRINLDTANTLREKLNRYYQALIRHYIILSTLGIAITLLLFLTGSKILIISYIVLLVLLSINRPTLKSIIAWLKLSKEEQEILYKKMEIGGE